MEDKLYETERFVGNGDRSAFFRIRNHTSLGVRMRFDIEGENARQELNKELHRARILSQLGVSVPRYVDVIRINVSEYIEETFEKVPSAATKHKLYEKMKQFFIDHKSLPVWGLVMEYIDDDAVVIYQHLDDKEYKRVKEDPVLRQKFVNQALISAQRLDLIYMRELYKIWDLGIDIGDSSSGLNVMWSQNRHKIYFIDFESWDFSKMKTPTETSTQKKSFFSRLKEVFG